MSYRYSPKAWAVACDRSTNRSHRRRARRRRNQVLGSTVVLALGLVGLLLLWWLA